MSNYIRRQKGFTLIEIIVTLVIVALAGMVVFLYLGSALTRSHKPLIMVGHLGESINQMEEVTAQYNRYRVGEIPWDNGTDNFAGWLNSKGISPNLTTIDEAGASFQMLEVVITNGDQTVSAYFTQ